MEAMTQEKKCLYLEALYKAHMLSRYLQSLLLQGQCVGPGKFQKIIFHCPLLKPSFDLDGKRCEVRER